MYNLAMPSNDRFRDFEAFLQRECARKMKLIDRFVKKNGFTKRIVSIGGCKILILSESAEEIPHTKLAMYADKYMTIKDKYVKGKCLYIVNDTIDSGTMIGGLSGNCNSDFAGWSTHHISRDELADGSVLSCDFTAAYNIDEGQGNFHLLVIRTDNLDSLLGAVGDLYGGNWKKMQSHT